MSPEPRTANSRHQTHTVFVPSGCPPHSGGSRRRRHSTLPRHTPGTHTHSRCRLTAQWEPAPRLGNGEAPEGLPDTGDGAPAGREDLECATSRQMLPPHSNFRNTRTQRNHTYARPQGHSDHTLRARLSYPSAPDSGGGCGPARARGLCVSIYGHSAPCTTRPGS